MVYYFALSLECQRHEGQHWVTVPSLFAIAGPRAWNNLLDTICHSSSLATFKRALKSHLFLQCSSA